MRYSFLPTPLFSIRLRALLLHRQSSKMCVILQLFSACFVSLLMSMKKACIFGTHAPIGPFQQAIKHFDNRIQILIRCIEIRERARA